MPKLPLVIYDEEIQRANRELTRLDLKISKQEYELNKLRKERAFWSRHKQELAQAY